MEIKEEMKLENLGYDSFFENNRSKLNLTDFQVARVISEYRGSYKIKNADGEFLAKITGKQIFDAQNREDYPAVGDWVAIKELGDDQAVINSILPRRTIIKRKFGDKNKFGEKNQVQIIATNIDFAFVVESVDRDYSPNRFERYFSIIRDGGVQPVIILNKADLLPEKELSEKLTELKERFPTVDVLTTSTLSGGGLKDLRNYISSGKTYCFLGSSGVGKSSLINELLGRDLIKTNEVSLYSDRGKHTTTSRQMYFLPVRQGLDVDKENAGIVIDNPGMREVGMTSDNSGVDIVFDEIAILAKQCRYVDCSHTHESNCAVLEAVESGKINREQYDNYLNLKKEIDYYEMDDLEKREKDRRFGKFLKKAKQELKDFKNLGC